MKKENKMQVFGYKTEVEMDKALMSVINNYTKMLDIYMRITAKTFDREGKYLGCEVVFAPRDKKLHHVTVLTRYGIIKVRSKSGERLVKEIDENMCEWFDNIAQGFDNE